MADRGLRVSVIVPFHSNLSQLRECLGALNPLPEWAELTVVADGAHDSCHELAARHGARVIDVPGPQGPAVARNHGAAAATGDVLVFVDTDVVAAPGTLERFRARFEEQPEVDAVFGAYDENPRESR